MSMSPKEAARTGRVVYIVYGTVSLMVWTSLAYQLPNSVPLRFMVAVTIVHMLISTAYAGLKLIGDKED